MAKDDKPWDFGSFEQEQSLEQHRAAVRPIARWLYAQYLEFIEVGFIQEHALFLANDTRKQIMDVMLEPLKKKVSSSEDEAS